MDYSNAESQRDFSELIPHGTLAFGLLKIRRYNVSMGVIETPSKSTSAKYLDCEITLQGELQNRKIWTLIGVDGSEKYVNMGRAQIKAILETGHGASPENVAAYDLRDPNISDALDSRHYAALDLFGEGVPVAIKIKVETSEGYPDKNTVAVFLSPVPESGTKKDFDRLLTGDTKPAAGLVQPTAGGGAVVAKSLPTQPAWTAQAEAAAPAASPLVPETPVNPPQPQPTTPPSAPVTAAAVPSATSPPAPSVATTGAPSATSPSSPSAPSWLKTAAAAGK